MARFARAAGMGTSRPLALIGALCLVLSPLGGLAAAPVAAAAEPALAWAATVPVNGNLMVEHVAATPDGAVVTGWITGHFNGQTNAGGVDAFVARFSATGNLLWARQFGTAGDEIVYSISAHADSIFVAGSTRGSFADGSSTGRLDGFVARLTLAGNLAWARNFKTSTPSRAWSVAAGLDGSALVVGERWPLGSVRPATALIYRYGPTGRIIWSDSFGSVKSSNPAGARAYDVAADEKGFVVVGVAEGSIISKIKRSQADGWARRYTYAGKVSWTRQINAVRPNPDTGAPMEIAAELYAVALSSSGVLVAGSSGWSIVGPLEYDNNGIRFVRALDGSGAVRWTERRALSRAVGDCNGYVVIGGNQPGDPADMQTYTARLSSAGSEQWRFRRDSTSDEWREFASVARGRAHVYVVATAHEYASGSVTTQLEAWSVPASSGCPTTFGVSAPKHQLTSGNVSSSGGIPVVLRWKGTGGSGGIVRYELRQSTDGGAWQVVDNDLKAPLATRNLAPGKTYRFSVRAVDSAGNRTAWVNGATFKLVAKQESAAAIRYVGSWSKASSSDFLGGGVRHNSTAYSRFTFTFTGNSIAWVSALGPSRGEARVFLDDKLVAITDLYDPVAQPRAIVYERAWSKVATHTLRVEVVGTAGHPRVDLDALLVTR